MMEECQKNEFDNNFTNQFFKLRKNNSSNNYFMTYCIIYFDSIKLKKKIKTTCLGSSYSVLNTCHST